MIEILAVAKASDVSDSTIEQNWINGFSLVLTSSIDQINKVTNSGTSGEKYVIRQGMRSAGRLGGGQALNIPAFRRRVLRQADAPTAEIMASADSPSGRPHDVAEALARRIVVWGCFVCTRVQAMDTRLLRASATGIRNSDRSLLDTLGLGSITRR